MSKFYDKVGYASYEEVERGIDEEQYREVYYFGDVKRKRVQQTSEPEINNGIKLNVQISIVADEYAFSHFSSIRYVWYLGQKWKVDNVDVAVPRLNLDVGGLYNDTGVVIEDA